MRKILYSSWFILMAVAVEGQTNIFPLNGNAGIGTLTPVSRLSIVDPGNGWLISSRASAIEIREINGMKFFSGYSGDNDKWAGIASVAESYHSNGTGLALYTSTSEKIRISSTGNVGIGTTTPAEKLAVNGNIRAKEIKVETANWPDYVFANSYELPSLSQESYIKIHQHLPGMPSATQAEQSGINLGEMNRKLLEKIEEMTLQWRN